MLSNIRHKLQASMEMGHSSGLGSPRGAAASTSSHGGGGAGSGPSVAGKRGASQHPHAAALFDLPTLLAEAGVGSLEELMATLHQAEEAMFVMYNDMQVRPYIAPT